MQKSLVTSFVIIAALVSASSGTASRVQVEGVRPASIEDDRSNSDSSLELREEFHQTYPLAANGRVSVENLNGLVRIAVWDRNEVQVDAVKRAFKKERLKEAKIEVSASSEAIRIKTSYVDREQNFGDAARSHFNNPATVDYSITVPRKARLESVDLVNGSLNVDGVEGDVKASSVNGRIIARGLRGVANISTVNGALDASFASLDEAKPISLNSVNGSVLLVIPSDANATVRAETVHGVISNDFGFDTQHGDYAGHELYGQLGAGGPRIKLRNVNGRILIKRAQDGRKLSSATCLLSQKDNQKETHKSKGYGEGDEQKDDRKLSAEARRAAAAARRAELGNRVRDIRITRETQAEIKQEVERAIREAQREIQTAQREIQRESQRLVREQVRREIQVEAIGTGPGKGKGRGERISHNRFTERESKSFTVSGAPNVNVKTFDGAITIHGWDKPEVMYTANKRANDAEAARQITVQSEQQGSTISIIAKSNQGNGVASLDVYLPRNATLHVSSDDGSLRLEGVSGDLNLRSGDGSIEVTNGHGQLQVNTGDGHIKISNFDGKVDARTGDGAISLEGKFDALAARTGSGSISLSVPANSEFTIETNAEGIDNEGLAVSEDMAPSQRVRRWRVGRGGRLFVLSTGEGRITLHRR